VFSKNVLFSVPVGALESSIRDTLAKNNENTITIVKCSNIDLAIPKIEISEEQLFVDILGQMASKLDYKKGKEKKDVLEKMPFDIMVGIAVAVGHKGHCNLAAELFAKYFVNSHYINVVEIYELIIACLKVSRRFDLALKLLKDIASSEVKEYYLCLDCFLILLLFNLEIGSVEFNALEEILPSVVERARKDKVDLKIASLYYSFGNKLRRGDLSSKLRALSYYNKAAKYDKNYRNRDYFYAEIAGILFGLCRYECSARFYQKASELGNDKKLLALKADALLFAGKYLESYELFDRYDKENDKPESEWILKKWATSRIMEKCGIKDQRRRIFDAFKSAEILDVPESKAEEMIMHSFQLDAFSGLAWFNLGVIKGKEKNHKEAFASFLIAALSQPNDIEAWSNAIICIMGNKEVIEYLPHILSVAYRVGGETFFGCLSGMINKQVAMTEDQKVNLINSINDSLHEIAKEEKQSRVIRFISKDGKYKIIEDKED
jgi:tetratricopeptide (TPR) repeat protein